MSWWLSACQVVVLLELLNASGAEALALSLAQALLAEEGRGRTMDDIETFVDTAIDVVLHYGKVATVQDQRFS